MIEDLCKKLKDERNKLSYRIEDVVDNTKLHPSVIKAIEECRLDEISPVYLKGFIKLYASFLGVDVGDELKSISPVKPPRNTGRPRTKPIRHKVRNTYKMNFINNLSYKDRRNILLALILIVSFIFVLMLIFSVVRLVKYKRPSLGKKNNYSENVKPKAAVPNKGSAVVVSIKVKRDCFIRAKRDGKIVFEGVLRKGIVEEWRAQKELEFSINDGSSVIVEVNGRILPPLSKIYEPIKSLKITPKGISIVR